MNKLQRVLLLEKNQADINAIIQQVKRINSKSEFQSAISKSNFEQKLKSFKPDLILANYQLPALSGIKALEIAQTHASDTPFIFVTDAQNEETAAECIKRGASDYILKTNLKRLVPAIKNVLKSFPKQTKESSAAINLTNIPKQQDVLAALQTSEKMFHKMADNIPDGLMIIEHGKVKFFNERIGQITGCTPAEIVNLNLIDLAAPEEKERLAKVIKEEQKTGYGPRELKFWIVRPDGTRRYLHNRYSYSREAGKIATRYIITTDLTEYKEAEQTGEQERVLLKTLVDHLPSSIFIKDQNFKKILVNSAHLARVATTLGHANQLTEGDLLGKTDFEVYPKNLAEEYYAEDQRVIKNGETILNKEQFSFDQKGQPCWELISKIPLRNKDGAIIGMVGISNDITTSKQAEEALRASEEKYRSLTESSKDSIYLVNENGYFLFANQTYLARLGQPLENVVGKSYGEFHSSADTRKFLSKLGQVYHQRKWLSYEHQSHRDKRYFIRTLSPVNSPVEDQTIAVTVISKDITEWKEIEEALQESEKKQRTFSFRLTRILNVVNQLSSIQLLDELCRQAVELGIQELGFNRIGLWFLAEDLKTMHGSYGTDETGNICDERHIQAPVTDFAVQKVLKNKHQVVFFENELLIGKDTKAVGKGNHAIAKLTIGDKIIGILGADNLIDKKPINEQDQEILGLYATALANLYMLKKTEEKIKATQKIYQQAIQNAQGIPYLLNYTTNHYDFIGEECKKVLGISPNQMSLTKLRSLIRESHVNISGIPNDETTAAELFKSGKVDYYQSDFKIITPEGQVKWLSDSAVPFIDESSGKVIGSLGILQEITDRKRSEAVQHVLYQITNAVIETTDLSQFLDFVRQALSEIIDTTNFFVTLYDKQNDTLTLPYFIDQKDHFTSFPAGRSLTGYIIKKNQPLLVYEQDIKKMVAKGTIDLIGTPSKIWLGVPIIFGNEVLGAVVVQSYTNQNAYHQNDLEVLKFISNQIGVLIDRKQTDVALRASEERFRSIFEDSPVGIALFNTNGNFIESNSEFFNILGITDRQLIRQLNLFEIGILKNSTKKDLFQRKSVKFEQEINFDNWQSPHLHHGIIYLNVLIAPFHTERSVFNYLVQIQDITDHKKIEQESLRSEKLESIGMLAGGIAHDFNNILTGILGNVSLARIYAKDDEIIKERLNEAEKAVMRARDLTQRLLTFSKGGLPIKKILDIANLIEESTKFVLAGSKAKSIIQRAADLWAVEADEGQINQVLNNIIFNADQAMPEGGIINIQVENYLADIDNLQSLNPGKYVKVSIIDQGIGIPSEHLSKIFDPYFTTKKRGSGLGLATAFSIVKNHNGKIEVVSELGKGSTFSVYLPATEAAAEVPEHVSEEQPLGEGRVLVVDDEKIVREVVVEMIRRLGYEVNAVKDGREAIAQYRKSLAANQPYAAIIMDLIIPGGMGGKEAISQLLAIDPDAKVIVSSGYSTDPIMSNFSQYGFKGVVAKPYDLYELGKVLKKVITGK